MHKNAFNQIFISLGKITVLSEQFFHWFNNSRKLQINQVFAAELSVVAYCESMGLVVKIFY